MRLRKIELGSRGFLQQKIGAGDSLVLYLDKVSQDGDELVRQRLLEYYPYGYEETFTYPRYSVDGQLQEGSFKVQQYLFTDREFENHITNPDSVLWALTKRKGLQERFGYSYCEAPTLRGAVPLFEGSCAYLEALPLNTEKLAKVVEMVNEYETSEHQAVLEGILRGDIKKYEQSVLYEHLRKTKQEYLW